MKTEPINRHSGSKYVRKVKCVFWVHGHKHEASVDIYTILDAYKVTCPARAHAIKKLLCAGLRGKGTQVADLQEAIDAMQRAVELQTVREEEETKGE